MTCDAKIFADQLADWARGQALPFWADAGVDKKFGGFIEELNLDGHDAALPHKRTRVSCRQVYVYAHADVLGWYDGKALVAQGLEYLTAKAWQGDDAGFARRLTRDGDILDPTPDLYDHAFALFAFAWGYRATREPAYRDWALRTLAFIQNKMAHKSGEGFWHEKPPTGYRLQNPHMHLLEASLAAFEATEEPTFSETATHLAKLFETRFFQLTTATLAEYFSDDWSLAPDEKGRIVEPGHHLEWAWILDQCQRQLGQSYHGHIKRLVAFSETHGINSKTGAVKNVVRDDGVPIDTGSRTWPNTERLKAAVTLLRMGQSDQAREMIEKTSRVLLDTYLSPMSGFEIPPGAWIDAFDGEGRPIAKRVPASTFYHLFLAIAEVDQAEL